MKKISSLFIIATAFACTGPQELTLSIHNPLPENRTNELAEVPAHLLSSVKKKTTDQFVITDAAGKQIPYQLTHDEKIIFPVTIAAEGDLTYTVRVGRPDSVPTLACGDIYPERLDDVAWENDRIAFRTYGPALQATGEKAFGYDVWTKNVSRPVVKERYAKELDKEARAKIAELRRTDPEAANAWARSISYHVDHGEGMDFYSVGPTLGAGTSALMVNDSIRYPYCYKSCEILDNGPLRFTVRLTYAPFTAGPDTAVTETRLLSLDAGSHFNRTVVMYDGLRHPQPIVTGLVTHAPSEEYQADVTEGYIAYGDAEQTDNGRIYVAAVIPRSQPLDEAGSVSFTEEEKKQRGATGHILARSQYRPGTSYTYYWGAGWSKYGFATSDDWYAYVRAYARSIETPLTVRVR